MKDTADNGTLKLNKEQKILLHQSFAHYLHHFGFSETLEMFRSEAGIDKDDLEVSSDDVEEMCLKYSETWHTIISKAANQEKLCSCSEIVAATSAANANDPLASYYGYVLPVKTLVDVNDWTRVGALDDSLNKEERKKEAAKQEKL